MRLFVAGVLVCSGWCWTAFAQTVRGAGAVAGFAVESPGNGLPETEVTIWNPDLVVRRTVVSTDDGAFDLVGLPPGSGYHLKLTRQGFVDWESGAFEVAIGQTRFLQVQMRRTGNPEREVAVESVTTRVDATQNGVSTWIDPVSTRSLPAEARQLDTLLSTVPATTRDSSGRLVMLGQASANSVATDGIRVTKGFSGELPRSAAALTQDSTLELRVLTAAYPVEFGHAAGGVVDSVSRSGSNDYHAEAFLQIRDGDFNAQNRFAPGQSLLGKRTHAGGAGGGPLRRDRLFIFANLESLTDHFNAVNQTSAPALSALPCSASATQCAAAVRYIQSQNGVVAPFSEDWTSGGTRIDYRANAANTFTFALDARDSVVPEEARRQLVAPNGGLIGIKNSTEDARYLRLGWTAAPSTAFTNELRLGLVSSNYDEPASEPNPTTGNLAITVAGVTVGSVHPNRSMIDERRFELTENVTITSGTHTLRMGADRAKTRDNLDTLNSAGSYSYPSLMAFALDLQGASSRNYSVFTQQFGTSQRSAPYREIGLYAQDTWRAFSRLELTYGVRWEKTGFPEVPVANPTYYQSGSIPSPSNAVSPRISLAYLFNDHTVLRAAYGRFFAPYQGQAIDALLNGNGLSQTTITVNANQTSGPLFPNTSKFSVSGTGTGNILYASSNLADPHTNQATLALERSIGRETAITASWISSHGVDLWTGSDVNLAGPSKTAVYPIYNANGGFVSSYSTNLWTAKNDSKQAHVYSLGNDGWSWYNAGVLEVRQRIGTTLNLRASYTWSHATGTNTGPSVDGVFSLVSNPSDMVSDKGDLATDQRHRGVITWTWQPRFMHGDSWVARYVVNGWQLSGIGTVSSGLRYTPTVIVTGNQFSSNTMLYFTSLNGAGGWSRVPFESVNSLASDTRRNLDARITRSIPIRGSLRCLVGFEAYNVFNSQPVTGVNTVAYITSTTTSSSGAYSSVLRSVAGVGQGNSSAYSETGTSSRSAQVIIRLQF